MKEKYDHIGKGYNNTRQADPYLADRLFVLLDPHPAGLYLDIGCGTGNYTHALHRRGVRFIGMDPSLEMLDKARQANGEIDWRVGRAEETNLNNAEVDGIMATLTIHHWQDLKQGFAELYRVLKPGGSLVLFTSTPAQMEGYWLNHYFPLMLRDSIHQMPAEDVVKSAMATAGFAEPMRETYAVAPDLQDLFLYSGKHDPWLYFKPAVRNGISSFSSLANREEVEAGLIELRKDIEIGKIKSVMQSYDHARGDYLFMQTTKPTAG